MPKILITGNGFDISRGLPTQYSDFINILNYIESSSNITFEDIYSQTKTHEKIKTDFNEFEFSVEKIEALRNQLKDNTWYQFFKNELKIETWIDFELKIDYVLSIIYNSLNELNIVFSKGPIDALEIFYEREIFKNLNIEHYQVLHTFNIIDYHKTILNEIVLIDIWLKKRMFYVYEKITGFNHELIFHELFKSLTIFRNFFSEYFRIFVFPLYNNQKNQNQKSIFKSIDKHFTFNYTPTFENIYKKESTSFLHGKITSDSNNIVLGISRLDVEKMKIKNLIPFTKHFQKFNNNTDYTFLQEFAKNTALTTFQIFIYGHSLDFSDSIYISEVFNFIDELKSPKKRLIIIFHSEESKFNILKNLYQVINENLIDNLMRNNFLALYHIDSLELSSELEKDISYSLKGF
jgi:hypothetical protein